MEKFRSQITRIKCLLLASILLLCTACGAPAETTTSTTEEETPSVETQPETATPEPDSETEPESEPEPVIATIQDAVNAAGEKFGAVGIQAAVVKGGELYGTYTYGWATLDRVPMADDTRIRCASISKIVLGVAAMLMREEGYIDLDTDISEYWGETIVNPNHPSSPVTIRNLLTHTSSISNLDFTHSRDYETVKSMLTSGKAFSKKKPGSTGAYEYNNYAYDVLGMTLELASDKWVDDILRERLFDTMGIQGGYQQDGLNADQIATVYRENDYASLTAESQAGFLRGSFPGSTGNNYCGGLTISATDLAKLLILLANDGVYEGEQLLSAESVELLETSALNTVTGYKQCLALRLRNGYGRKGLYYHPGDGYGTYTIFAYDPATKDGVVILTTGASDAGDFAVYGEIATFAFKHLSELSEAEATPAEN